ncbi:hypothetical protein DPSP01_006680 [Paraphaeosphaeria sporulosa]
MADDRQEHLLTFDGHALTEVFMRFATELKSSGAPDSVNFRHEHRTLSTLNAFEKKDKQTEFHVDMSFTRNREIWYLWSTETAAHLYILAEILDQISPSQRHRPH